MPKDSSASFEERFRHHYDRLFGYAIALSRDRETASDLLHDCVARAMGTQSVPAEEGAFRAWLFRILRNLWIDHVRLARRTSGVSETLDTASEELDRMVPVGLESVLVEAFAVRQAFERLSPEHKEVLALVDISGFSYKETARILAVPPGTVMSRVSRARAALARSLSDEGAKDMRKKNGFLRQ